MDTRLLLQQQFSSTYDSSEWFVSLKQALQGLTEEQARQEVHPGLPSIFGLTVHLFYWNERTLKHIRGEKQEKAVEDNTLTFTAMGMASWDELYKKTCGIFESWREGIASVPEEHMEIARNTVTHNAYHIGQIVFLRKLQGSWDKKYGVT